MPRFLNTYTGEFVWIADVGATSYAILSHTWQSDEEGGEQTFDDVVKLQTKCPIVTSQPWDDSHPPQFNKKFFSHRALSDKIKRACEVARKAGFRLIWIDSCCIDKRSSAELSEAINSMYALYRDADVCYVYLADVPGGTDPREEESKFWKSRWHKRGWTLQELVAPPYVVFLAWDWSFLGTKTALASTLEKITRVDTAILLGLKPVESASVAKRMSWAAGRETTRVEDRAYSLLGIFGVHLSPIYGEGTNAFLRLQEEIIKYIPDQSIFAWGASRTLLGLHEAAHRFCGDGYYRDHGLLAPSPNVFWHVGDIAPITASSFSTRIGGRRDSMPSLHCVFTPQGARIALMTIPLPPETARLLVREGAADCPDCREAMARSPFRRLALLRCTDRDGNLIALPLRCPEEDVAAAENVTIRVHATCTGGWKHPSPRVVRLSPPVLKDLHVAPTCVEVSLLRRWQEPVKPKAHRYGFAKYEWGHPALWVSQHFQKALKIRLAPNCQQALRAVGLMLTPLAVESRQHENTGLTNLTLTTTLHRNIATQQPPPDDQHMHLPSILIEVELQLTSDTCARAQFSIGRLGKPSAIESTPLASSEIGSVFSRRPLDGTSAIADSGHRQSCSLNINTGSKTRTIAEAKFVIPDGTVPRTSANGVSMDYVRLLHLTLDNPLESAYVEFFDHLSFSVELSEPFLGSTASTEFQSAATPSSSPPSGHLADNSDPELPTAHIIPNASPTSDLPDGPPAPVSHDATQRRGYAQDPRGQARRATQFRPGDLTLYTYPSPLLDSSLSPRKEALILPPPTRIHFDALYG
ncbi:heterokaryon incompatibility protein-domain-containing protein [Lenzites betulinus]|nr:heterokaryon incompatibility protein-domain-containing protein [Lenzites betulinus]